MFLMRMHRHGREMVLAAADKELVGMVLREEVLKLDVCREFYEGEEGSEDVLLNRLTMCTVANLVGERAVAVAIREGYIDDECVLRIAGVPHAQLAKM